MLLLRRHRILRERRGAGELDINEDGIVKLPSGVADLPVGYGVAGQEGDNETQNAICPESLEEMMFIVRSLRGDQHDVLDPDYDDHINDVGTDEESIDGFAAVDIEDCQATRTV